MPQRRKVDKGLEAAPKGKPKAATSEQEVDEQGNAVRGHKANHAARTKKKYQRWTEERIEELGERLLNYMRANEETLFITEFFTNDEWGKEQRWYKDLPDYLAERSARFSDYYERARLLQEQRLIGKGLQPKVNAGFMEFLLVNKCDYEPRNGRKAPTNQTVNNQPTQINLTAGAAKKGLLGSAGEAGEITIQPKQKKE